MPNARHRGVVNVAVREHQCRDRLVAQLLTGKAMAAATLAAGQASTTIQPRFAFNQEGDVGNVKTT